jgi:hypothetical protein
VDPATPTNARAVGHLHYPRHFSVLAAATVVMFLLGHWDLLRDSLLVTFAINGALHACAIVLSLRAPPPGLARKAAFVAIAAALSVLTLYIGIIGLVLFAVLPGNERLYVVLSVCSLSGAITYGSLIRMFWIRILSSRIILAMAVLCVLATSLAFFARAYWEFLGGWWLAAAWWFAFSAGLWYFDTHSDVLPTRRKIPPKRET